MKSISERAVPNDRSAWSIGQTLFWHLDRGTRPKSSRKPTGTPWTEEEFADAVGDDLRNVQNWLNDRNKPRKASVYKIIQALLGGDEEHAWYRVELMEKCGLRRARKSSSVKDRETAGIIDTPTRVGSSPSKEQHTVVSPYMPSWSFPVLGREKKLEALHSILCPRDSTDAVRVALSGLGGIGKSTFALEYIRRFGHAYEVVWWCNAETPTTLLTGLSKLRRVLAEDAPDEPDLLRSAEDALQLVGATAKPHLLIYDNVASPDQLEYQMPDGSAKCFLPAGNSRVLITSRFPFWSELAHEFPLELLAPEAAERILLAKANSDDPFGAASLAKRLDRLPLAVAHAAALCERAGMSFKEYEERVTELIKERPRGTSYDKHVYATFNLAIAAVAKGRPAYEMLMAFLSHCGSARIPMSYLHIVLERERHPHRIIAALAEVSLLRHDPYPDGVRAVSVHRLVQDVGRLRAQANGSAQIAVDLVAVCLNSTFPNDSSHEPDSWQACEQLLPHILEVSNRLPKPRPSNWPEILSGVGAYFYARGDYFQAEAFCQQAVDQIDAQAVPNTETLARCLRNLALIQIKCSDLDKAGQNYHRSLDVLGLTLDSDHKVAAIVAAELGRIRHAKGDSAGARTLLEKAYKVAEKHFGDEGEEATSILNALAEVLFEQEEFEGAAELHEKTLGVRERLFGPEHLATIQSLEGVALSYFGLKRTSEAEALLTQVIVVSRRRRGPDHPSTLVSEYHLAQVLALSGRSSQALDLCEHAVAASEKHFGPDDPLVARYRSCLADILLALGRPVASLLHAEKALAVHQATRSESLRASASSVACALKALGQQQSASEIIAEFDLDPLPNDDLKPRSTLWQTDAEREMWERFVSILSKRLGLE